MADERHGEISLARVETLFHAALQQPAEQRRDFLLRAAPGEALLRAEVESLIKAAAERGWVESHPIRTAAENPPMLEPGARLGNFEVTGLLGRGGMGEVYRARDVRLQREVALKTLPPEFAGDANRIARFQREARAASTLNHPNIVGVYDVGQEQGIAFIVSELVEGETLAHFLGAGRVPVRKLVEIGTQIVDGLAAAHAAGIVHRDLHPANIMLRGDGCVKILDFGLAFPLRTSEQSAFQEQISAHGMVMGTAGYMSPEQIRSEPADFRSDLFSLGAILYEMAAGQPAFGGGSAVERMSATLHTEPPPLSPRCSPALAGIVRRCIEKDPSRRFQSVADLRAALKPISGVSPPAPRKLPKQVIWGIAAMFAAVCVAGVLIARRQAPQRSPLSNRDVLVLADFINNTGEPVFDLTLRRALYVQLQESPFLKIMDDAEMRDTLKLMGQTPSEHITNQMAREICIRRGEKALMQGSIARLGSSYVITLEATNCETESTLALEQGDAQDKEHVLGALAGTVAGMRAKLGESLASIGKIRRDVGVSTTSLKAFQAYALARTIEDTQGRVAALPFFERVVQMDPNFAMAHWELGLMYQASGEPERGNASIQKAFALIDRVSERERLLITVSHYLVMPGQRKKRVEAEQLFVQTYPRDASAHNIVALDYADTGDWEKALKESQEAVRLQPRVGIFYSNLMMVLICLDRFDEAKAIARQAFAAGVDFDLIHQHLLSIAYIQKDVAAIQKEIAWSANKPAEYLTLNNRARNAAILGQRRLASMLRRRAQELASKQNVSAAFIRQDEPLEDALQGDCAHSRKSLAAQAVCADSAAAQKILQSSLNPNADQVLYLQGRNLLKQREGRKAAVEFQKLLDHKGANWGPYFPVSYIGLARALVLAGDTARAIQAYQDLLALWKDADREIPVLRAARRELKRNRT